MIARVRAGSTTSCEVGEACTWNKGHGKGYYGYMNSARGSGIPNTYLIPVFALNGVAEPCQDG